MEAKDTVKRDFDKARVYYPGEVEVKLEAQAEISFRAGQKEERDSWLLKTDPEKARDAFTKDIIERSRTQAMREVVRFLHKQGVVWVDKNYAIIEAIEKMAGGKAEERRI